MASGGHPGERRRYPRISLQGEVPAKIQAMSAVPVIDLSASGALLEVPRPLNANAVYTLRLDFSSTRALVVKGRVVRTYVDRLDRAGSGDTMVRYRAAIEFVRLRETDQAVIHEFMDQLEGVERRETPEEEFPYRGLDRRTSRRVVASSLKGQIALYLDFQILQLSVGGMMVSLPVRLSIGSHHRFAIAIGDRDLEVQGEVLNCELRGRGEEDLGYRIGIEFRGLEKGELDVLERFVAERAGDGTTPSPEGGA